LNTTLAQALISILAKKKSASARWLWQRSAAVYRSCSIQAVYKELRKLEQTGVVIKAGKEYCLSLSWILSSLHHFDGLYTSLMTNSSLSTTLDKNHRHGSWKFYDLARTDDFWVQMMLNLFQESAQRQMYCWLPFPWFELVHHPKEVRFEESIRKLRAHMSNIIGGDGFLWRYCTKEWPTDVYDTSFAPSPFKDLCDTTLLVIDDFVLSIKSDDATTKMLKRFFSEVNSAADLTPQRVTKLLTSKVRFQVKLEKNLAKATKLERVFRNYFA
jgi:hypothetical protein